MLSYLLFKNELELNLFFRVGLFIGVGLVWVSRFRHTGHSADLWEESMPKEWNKKYTYDVYGPLVNFVASTLLWVGGLKTAYAFAHFLKTWCVGLESFTDDVRKQCIILTLIQGAKFFEGRNGISPCRDFIEKNMNL